MDREIRIAPPLYPGGNCCASFVSDPWCFAWAPTPHLAAAILRWNHPKRGRIDSLQAAR